MKSKKWSCQRSGHCCSTVGTLTMTHEERAVLEDRYPALKWEPHDDPAFTKLVGDPACPLLFHDHKGNAGCAVHDIRPYNCRRWGCFRQSTSEPFDVASVQQRIAGSRDIRRQAVRLQRKAQKWALDHGWDPSMR